MDLANFSQDTQTAESALPEMDPVERFAVFPISA